LKTIAGLQIPERYIDRTEVLACYSGLQAGWEGVLLGRIAGVSKSDTRGLPASLRLSDGIGNELCAKVSTSNPESIIEGAPFAYAGRVVASPEGLVFECFNLARRYVGKVEPRYPISSKANDYFCRLPPDEWEAAKWLAIHYMHFELGLVLPRLLSVSPAEVDFELSTALQDLHYPHSPEAGRKARSRIARILKAINHEKAQLQQLLLSEKTSIAGRKIPAVFSLQPARSAYGTTGG
jgi:hypothetical protein